jgi:hypothetical protein
LLPKTQEEEAEQQDQTEGDRDLMARQGATKRVLGDMGRGV